MTDTNDQPTQSAHVQQLNEAIRLLSVARESVEVQDWSLLRMAEQQEHHEAEDAERAQQLMDLRAENSTLQQALAAAESRAEALEQLLDECNKTLALMTEAAREQGTTGSDITETKTVVSNEAAPKKVKKK